MENETKFIIRHINGEWLTADSLSYKAAIRSSKTKLCHFLNKHTVMTLKEGEVGELTFKIIRGGNND